MKEVGLFERFDSHSFVQQIFSELLVGIDGFDCFQKVPRESREEIFYDGNIVETVHAVLARC